MNNKPGLFSTLQTYSDWVIPIGAVALVFVMLVPLPSFALDLLLTLNITAAVLVLLTAIQVLRPAQFSVFPSLILLLTLMRLALDVASTRRILLHGGEGSSAAGKVIEAFGQFVVGGNYIVGFVLFLALIAIQYLVVSHGAVRTAEVTARFTLDAMPGKQMAIDSDLNTGLINADQARQRRDQVAREAEFCGAMDGAARFSQRDSLATILITAINIVAGFLIGVFQQGVPFDQALKTYTILTVGDGLVAIVPSLLVSVAGGIVVTRAASEHSLGSDIGKQVFKTARPLWIAGGSLLALAIIPGMPKFSFIVLAGITMFAAWKMKPTAAAAEASAKAAAAAAKPGTLLHLFPTQALPTAKIDLAQCRTPHQRNVPGDRNRLRRACGAPQVAAIHSLDGLRGEQVSQGSELRAALGIQLGVGVATENGSGHLRLSAWRMKKAVFMVSTHRKGRQRSP